MSYQVLARKWRPRNFSTLVGQEHVVRALSHALAEKRLHHAYLFTGTRGVGKTTIARILAKSLNCEAGITATPCGQCVSCQEIDAGRFVDLLEVDAATNTRVDEMRQLLENAVYAPTRGRFKVYVIDEVHMLSNSAFNAMLKTLEEPPEHVKFILATTDPQKIPVTVLSRCLQFNLKQMPSAAIADHLANILSAEEIAFDVPALALIARSASGSMRDALSLLDQAIAHGAGQVEAGQVRSMLGTVDQDYLFSILEAVLGADAPMLLQIAAEIGMRSLSFSLALQELGALLTKLQVAQFSPTSIEDDPDKSRLLMLAESFSAEFVQLAYQIVNLGRLDLASAPDEHAGFVMTLLRLLAFRPSSVADVVASVTPRASSQPAMSALQHNRVPVTVPARTPSLDEHLKSGGGHDTSLFDGEWHTLVGSLQLSGLAKELAQNCELRSLDEGVCHLRIDPSKGHLQMKPSPDRLQQALSDYLGRAIQLKFEIGVTERDTPAVTVNRTREARQMRADNAIAQDVFVRDAMASLDATLVESSIKPID